MDEYFPSFRMCEFSLHKTQLQHREKHFIFSWRKYITNVSTLFFLCFYNREFTHTRSCEKTESIHPRGSGSACALASSTSWILLLQRPLIFCDFEYTSQTSKNRLMWSVARVVQGSVSDSASWGLKELAIAHD